MKPTFFGLLAVSVGLAVAAFAKSPKPQPVQDLPNFLFIAIDDLKPIGSVFSEDPGNFLQRVYPDPELRRKVAARMTPNIQRLADRGLTFMRAYCAAPACNPSRAAIMTGVSPHVSGLTTNAKAVFFRDWVYEGAKPLADSVTLAEHLKANGWYTASTGKIYHSGGSYEHSDGARSWTAWTNVKGTAGASTRSPFSPKSLPWGQEGDDNASFKLTNDYRKADFIARVLENGEAADGDTVFRLPADAPFFLACGIFRPHLPFYTTKELIDLFPPDEMSITRELLQEFIEDCSDLPATSLAWTGVDMVDGDPVLGSERFVDILEQGQEVAGPEGDLSGWRDMLAHYFASCAQADRAVGRLLDGLDRSPYAENTVVVLWSDHGYHLGEKVRETKFTLWDDAAMVNFIIADPRRRENAGALCYRPVTLTDIYPTLANMAGVSLPDPRINGADLAPLLNDPMADWSRPAHTTFRSVHFNQVRTERFKLIRYGTDNTELELYDLDHDPEEFSNLAGRTEWVSQQTEMLQILEAAINR